MGPGVGPYSLFPGLGSLSRTLEGLGLKVVSEDAEEALLPLVVDVKFPSKPLSTKIGCPSFSRVPLGGLGDPTL